ncbi:MAG: helix-turn-helix domain-containing protein [Flavobacterium sp.]
MHIAVVNKIKYLRKSKNISAQEMADKLSIDLSAYHRLESGKTHTWCKYLDDILSIFEISGEEFFHNIEDEVKAHHKKDINSKTSLHIENVFVDTISKIEKINDERLKDKDNMIVQLQKVIQNLCK